jgi:hypothetical protein
MKNEETMGKTNRQTYKKPKLEQVQLVVEEAFVDACKTGTGGSVPKCTPKPTTIGCNKSPQRS